MICTASRFVRGLALASIAGLLLAVPTPHVSAQETAAPPTPRAKHPRPNNAERSGNLEFLFGALKAAPDAESAKGVENRILALWLNSGSDTADLLMTRVKTAVDAKDFDLAIKLLDSIVEIKPEYV